MNPKTNSRSLRVESLEQRNMLAAILAEPQSPHSSSATYDPAVSSINAQQFTSRGEVSGELKQWHRVTIDFQGPSTSETASQNPFLDFRLDVTFVHHDSGQTFLVPGFYAADGNAGLTHANSGNVWRVHFAPNRIGDWTYVASFRAGDEIAVAASPVAGTSGGFFDGQSGTFTVAESDKAAPDFRTSDLGLIKNRGHHYMTYAGGGVFLKGGPNVPENFFGYAGFDNTPSAGHDFDQHISDWNPGDPDWDDDDSDSVADDGRGIIGALNFVADEGGNSIYFLPMNIGGDGQDTFPTIAAGNKTRYDVSKLDQWELAFSHATSKGIMLHFQLAETENANENYHDNGTLGIQRKLYYRELIARFGHHLGVQYNVGEENDYGTTRRRQFAAFIKSIDPYDHPVTSHTRGNDYDDHFNPLLGNGDFDITSFQGGNSRTSMANLISTWRTRSANAGTPWAISFDEPQKIENDKSDSNNGYIHGRRDKMWPVFMAGGAGFEWYVQEDGGGHGFDQRIDDFRAMDDALNWTGYAVNFLSDMPLLEMSPSHSLGNSTAGNNTYVLAKPNDTYAMYNDRNGSGWTLNLAGATGQFEVKWLDPRNGGGLQNGSVLFVNGGGTVSLGNAPDNINQDWAAVVRRAAPQGPNQAPIVTIDDISPAPVTEGGVFQEENGLVVFEMESTSATGSWELQTAIPGYTGEGYYRWEGPNLFGNPGAQGVMEYKLNITNPGTYQMRFHNHRDAGTADQENDIWAKMDNGNWIKVFTGIAGQWNWGSSFDFGEGNRPGASYQLSAGEHTFYVSGRSQGFRVDRVAFYNTSLISAGQAQNLNNPQSQVSGGANDLTFDLSATVSDDGQVLNTPSLLWQLEFGLGTAEFGNNQAADTRVQFSNPGIYVVSLTADDGEFQSVDRRLIIAPLIEGPSNQKVLIPIDDATVQGTSGLNDAFIKVQSSGPERTGYLKFDVSGFDQQTIIGAQLQLTVSQDPGSGELALYQGATNAWNEETINSSNAPAAGTILDTVSGTHSVGQTREFDVSSIVEGDGIYSFVLEHNGGNDVWFSSKEGSSAPELVLEFASVDPLPGDYDRNGTVDLTDQLVWLLSFGSTVDLYADGNGDGIVDAADFTIWRDAYNNGLQSQLDIVVDSIESHSRAETGTIIETVLASAAKESIAVPLQLTKMNESLAKDRHSRHKLFTHAHFVDAIFAQPQSQSLEQENSLHDPIAMGPEYSYLIEV